MVLRLRTAAANNRAVRFAYRAGVMVRHSEGLRERPRESLRYLARGREISNFTYEISNLDALAACVAESLGVDPALPARYIRELAEDMDFRQGLAARLREDPRRDDQPKYGYRYVNYCLVRIERPEVVAELGTHDGAGAAVLLRALQRNEAEGSPGTLLAFDDMPEAGWLIDDSLRLNLVRIIGDIRSTLEPELERRGVDVLVHDIGCHWEGHRWALETGLAHARGDRLVISSEVDETTHLRELCEREGGRYATFRERPVDHFWPGHVFGLGTFSREA